MKREERIKKVAEKTNDLEMAKQVERMERLKEANEAIALGSHDTGDPTTTNLYVGNLAPTVSIRLWAIWSMDIWMNSDFLI